MQDIAGIDVGARIRQYLKSMGKSRAEGPQSAVPDRLYEMGRYGQKTGAGWYKYDAPGGRNRTPDPLVEALAEEEAKKRGITRRVVQDEEIVARITTALANEGARVLEEGYATRAGASAEPATISQQSRHSARVMARDRSASFFPTFHAA